MKVIEGERGHAIVIDDVDFGPGRVSLTLNDAREIAREVMRLDGLVPTRHDPAFRECLTCKVWFLPKRSTRKFCDDRCRATFHEVRRVLTE